MEEFWVVMWWIDGQGNASLCTGVSGDVLFLPHTAGADEGWRQQRGASTYSSSTQRKMEEGRREERGEEMRRLGLFTTRVFSERGGGTPPPLVRGKVLSALSGSGHSSIRENP